MVYVRNKFNIKKPKRESISTGLNLMFAGFEIGNLAAQASSSSLSVIDRKYPESKQSK